MAEDEGFERAAPVRTLVQKVSGGHFLARGRIHGLRSAPGTGVGLSPFLLRKLAAARKIGICRIPGHCDKVAHTGVAISWLDVPFLVDGHRNTGDLNGLYDGVPLGIRWRFPHHLSGLVRNDTF